MFYPILRPLLRPLLLPLVLLGGIANAIFLYPPDANATSVNATAFNITAGYTISILWEVNSTTRYNNKLAIWSEELNCEIIPPVQTFATYSYQPSNQTGASDRSYLYTNSWVTFRSFYMSSKCYNGTININATGHVFSFRVFDGDGTPLIRSQNFVIGIFNSVSTTFTSSSSPHPELSAGAKVGLSLGITATVIAFLAAMWFMRRMPREWRSKRPVQDGIELHPPAYRTTAPFGSTILPRDQTALLEDGLANENITAPRVELEPPSYEDSRLESSPLARHGQSS